ncbi:MAG: subtilisin-like proprotein convertase family protein, partial [Pirellulaceae bacterium]
MSRIAHRRRQLRIESLESRRVLTATTLVSTPDYTLKLDDSDSFVIMEVPSDGYTEWDNGTSSRSLATQRIYDLFTDDFDFIMFVNNASTHSASYSGQYSSVQNEITGTGDSIFDLTSNYGSAGALQGVIHLTRGSGIRGGPSLHEIMHRWANDVTLLGGDTSGHWGYTNVGGQLGGWQSGTLVDNGNGTFNADGPTGSDWFGTFANGGNGLPYSQFELYLMGLIDANEVTQDIIVANDPVWTNSGIGEFSASSLTTYSIGDIVADEGPREPNVANSQKDFRAMVVVVSAGPMSEGEQTAFTTDIANFSANGSDGINGIYNFWEATGGRANIQMDDLAATLADSGSVSGTIWEDVNENLVQDAGEVGIPNRQVYLDGNGNGVRDEQRDTFYASDVTQDIADQATTNSVLHLNGYAGSITDLNVNLFIEHTSDQQLEVTLMSPTGTTATLFNSVGDGGQDFLDTTLDDEAATPIGSGAAPFTGSFRPTESLSAFDNEDPNGNWTLSITDSAAGGGGRLVAWSIDLGTGQQEPAASTTANGDYQIDNVASGEYEVRQVPFAGSTQTFPSATARLVVTEISLNTPDWLEIQNVSTAAIDTTGWSVALAENPAGGINNISSVVWDLPDSVNAGEVLYRTDTNDNYWGTNINWSEFNGATGWVMIIDDTGNMVDWVGWGWAESALSQLDVTVNGHVIQGVGSHWSGTSPSGDDPTADQTGTLRRIGAADTNSGADWEWNAPGSLGMENPDLTTPLSASDFHTISVRAGEVTDNVDFGNLTADAPPQVTSVELNATQIDPPDLAKGPQPTKWQVQRSDIRSIEVAF